MKLAAALPWALAAAVKAAAQTPEPTDLPPLAEVAAAMQAQPPVQAARATIRAEQANRDRLRSGPYEYALRADGAQRRAADPLQPLQHYAEWSVSLERPLRLPDKSRIDRQLGEQGVTQAELAYGDALHEAERGLLAAWFSWVRERVQVRQWESQVGALQQQLEAVDKRVRAGDASRVEAGLADADVAQAQGSLRQAQARERLAANDLAIRFAGVRVPADLPLPAPLPVESDLEYWREQVLQRSHELALARAEGRKAQITATRARADLMPDPTVGLRYSSELGGAERVMGIYVSIPIPGGARAAGESAARAQSDVALQREAAVRRKLEAEAANNYTQAVASYRSWQSMSAAAERIQRNADLTARAYSLGELGLLDVLTARRQALETQLAATLTAVDAAEARYRLMLDAHQLWALDADAPPEGH